MKIQYFVRSVYGVPTIYTTGHGSDSIKNLTGKKTISAVDMSDLEALGMTFERVQDPEMVVA